MRSFRPNQLVEGWRIVLLSKVGTWTLVPRSPYGGITGPSTRALSSNTWLIVVPTLVKVSLRLLLIGSRSVKRVGQVRIGYLTISPIDQDTIELSPSLPTWLLGKSFKSIKLTNSAYLVRHEILALHQRGKPQAYPVCFQAQLTGTGTARPTDTAKFPEAYNINDEFKNYNVFDMSQDHSQFIFPGPPVYKSGAGPVSDTPAPVPAASSSAAPSSPSAISSPAGGLSNTLAALPVESAPAQAPGPSPAVTSSASGSAPVAEAPVGSELSTQ